VRLNQDWIPDSAQRAFETLVRIRFHEVDQLGHVNNAAYLNYLEQAAIDHAAALGLDMDRMRRLGGIFVAKRHEIDFLRPAYAGEVLRILTWVGVPRGASIERRYVITRESDDERAVPLRGRLTPHGASGSADNVIALALTEWVFAGGDGKPRRIPRELSDLFANQDERVGDER
jgi:acyl-CoA thioester hydrolase